MKFKDVILFIALTSMLVIAMSIILSGLFLH